MPNAGRDEGANTGCDVCQNTERDEGANTGCNLCVNTGTTQEPQRSGRRQTAAFINHMVAAE